MTDYKKTVEKWNHPLDAHFPYSIIEVFKSSNYPDKTEEQMIRFENLRGLYYYLSGMCRKYIRNSDDGIQYLMWLESESARRSVPDKEALQEALIDGWLMQIEDTKERAIVLAVYANHIDFD